MADDCVIRNAAVSSTCILFYPFDHHRSKTAGRDVLRKKFVDAGVEFVEKLDHDRDIGFWKYQFEGHIRIEN